MSYNAKNYTEQGGAVTHFGGKVIFEEGCSVDGLPKAGNQAASTATTVAQLKDDILTDPWAEQGHDPHEPT